MGFFNKLKQRLASDDSQAVEEDAQEQYVELDAETIERSKAKITVKPFVMAVFDDVKPVIDALRDGKIIALVNIKPLKDKDVIELKRAINKLKKTCDAIEGDIAGFGENWIAAVPSFAKIYRGKRPAPQSEGISQSHQMEAE